MTCSGRYASVTEYATFWGQCATELTDPTIQAEVEAQLDLGASDIHMALSATGACDCTLSAYGEEWLKKINMINTAVTYRCSCGPKLSTDDKQLWMEWLDNQLTLLREGKIDPCEGATGSTYPAVGRAAIAWTDANAARIIRDAMLREL